MLFPFSLISRSTPMCVSGTFLWACAACLMVRRGVRGCTRYWLINLLFKVSSCPACLNWFSLYRDNVTIMIMCVFHNRLPQRSRPWWWSLGLQWWVTSHKETRSTSSAWSSPTLLLPGQTSTSWSRRSSDWGMTCKSHTRIVKTFFFLFVFSKSGKPWAWLHFPFCLIKRFLLTDLLWQCTTNNQWCVLLCLFCL